MSFDVFESRCESRCEKKFPKDIICFESLKPANLSYKNVARVVCSLGLQSFIQVVIS